MEFLEKIIEWYLELNLIMMIIIPFGIIFIFKIILAIIIPIEETNPLYKIQMLNMKAKLVTEFPNENKKIHKFLHTYPITNFLIQNRDILDRIEIKDEKLIELYKEYRNK